MHLNICGSCACPTSPVVAATRLFPRVAVFRGCFGPGKSRTTAAPPRAFWFVGVRLNTRARVLKLRPPPVFPHFSRGKLDLDRFVVLSEEIGQTGAWGLDQRHSTAASLHRLE